MIIMDPRAFLCPHCQKENVKGDTFYAMSEAADKGDNIGFIIFCQHCNKGIDKKYFLKNPVSAAGTNEPSYISVIVILLGIVGIFVTRSSWGWGWLASLFGGFIIGSTVGSVVSILIAAVKGDLKNKK